ncbi:mechanosensitive ion channel domain-containing protein [Thalassoroseus pseudoceratinae]|uniref:mechanosensitive ion channel domain-containing protein n=1 Tax=Thalassoroseus pseudoceratinae TaxID=2713176 RepID=UPI00141EEEC5|nr:mechanosensitive ion channel domain-containing protein [Thalassoroseus pseudoceratinae]
MSNSRFIRIFVIALVGLGSGLLSAPVAVAQIRSVDELFPQSPPPLNWGLFQIQPPDPESIKPSQITPRVIDQTPMAPPKTAENPAPVDAQPQPQPSPQPVVTPANPNPPEANTTESAQPMPATPAGETTETKPQGATLTNDKPTIASVEAAIAKVKGDKLDEAVQKEIVSLYEQALADLKEAEGQIAKGENFTKSIEETPALVKDLKQQKEAVANEQIVIETAGKGLTELRQELLEREQKLVDQKAKLEELISALKKAAAQEQLAKERKDTQERLTQLEEQLKKIPNGADATPSNTAERVRLQAKKQLLQATLGRIDKEGPWLQSQTEVLPLKRDIAARRLMQLEEEIKRRRAEVEQALAKEVKTQSKQAESLTKAAVAYAEYPTITRLSERIETLASLRSQAAERVPEIVAELEKTEILLEDVRRDHDASRERVKISGRNNNVGQLLRLRRNSLPDVRKLYIQIFERQDEIQEVQVEQSINIDRANELAVIDKACTLFYENPECSIPLDKRDDLRPLLEKLLNTEKQNLEDLNVEYGIYQDKLLDLDDSQKRLVEETQDYLRFISENILWIRSTNELWNQEPANYESAIRYLTNPSRWENVLIYWKDDIVQNPFLWGVALIAFVLLLMRGRRMRRQVHALGDAAQKKSCNKFRPTAETLGLTILIAGMWPATWYFIGWRLSGHLESPLFVTSVASGFMAMGLTFFPLELFRQICRNRGLAQAHFDWPKDVLGCLRGGLKWMIFIGLPFTFISATLAAASFVRSDEHESLGRLCLVAALIISSVFVFRVLRPGSPTMRDFLKNHSGTWIERTKYVWSYGALAVCITFAVLAVMGYQYTSTQLVSRLYGTLWIVFAFVTANAIAERWLLVTRRRVAMEQYRRRREAAQSDSLPIGQPDVIIDDPQMALSEMNLQTRQLLRSFITMGVALGMWFTWADVLPALSVLKKVEVPFLTIDRVVSPTEDSNGASPGPTTPVDTATASDTETAVAAKTVAVPITLADLTLALLIVIVSIAAVRNLPGLLELMVLQRLPIDNAARYAITTLSRYALTFIGISAAFYAIGFRWEHVQWLAAALMLGLGFGLQEIFANFFSGLIVLLERPVRVGDIVTVNGTDGIVSRIRMRATTITNWERKEMIIPNKDLITGTVLNWTLSDQVQRVFISVGIAYGSDTKKATQLLYEVMQNHPAVMNDPAPNVTFNGFGDSALTFEVRCYLPRADLKLPTTHELHTQIDEAFRAANIEISFPQRDLHIRSVDAHALFNPMPTQHAAEESTDQDEHQIRSA